MLFLRELKKVVFSFTFLILIVGMLFMAASQDVLIMSGQGQLEMPQIGQDYGTQIKEVPEVIMPTALQSLYAEFCYNKYTTYPIGFYKSVKLSENKMEQIADIISTLTDIPMSELLNTIGSKPNELIPLKEDISYDDFLVYMEKADGLIGGGSKYSDTYLISNFGRVPITYEEAVDSYNLVKDTDLFTGAYARLFSDYMLILLSILPVFLAVSLCLKDKRPGIRDLIYTRKVSSVRIMLSRYIAIITAVMVPTLILAYISNISIWSVYSGMALDYLAPIKYCLGWILPSVMAASAVGMLLSELTNTAIAIVVQGLWWVIDISIGAKSIGGSYRLLSLIPRHNSLQKTQFFIDNFNSLAVNRLLFAGLSVLLIVATAIVYEQKRRGRLNGFGKNKEHLADLADSEDQPAA